jgi:hypothetical protein
VHAVGKLDDHHRALARCPDQSARDRSRASPKLSQDDLHAITLAIPAPASTEFPVERRGDEARLTSTYPPTFPVVKGVTLGEER